MTNDQREILSAYHTLFAVVGGETAKKVLADLAYEAYMDRTTAAEDSQGRLDPLVMAFREGHRALFNKLLARIREGGLLGAPQPAAQHARSSME